MSFRGVFESDSTDSVGSVSVSLGVDGIREPELSCIAKAEKGTQCFMFSFLSFPFPFTKLFGPFSVSATQTFLESSGLGHGEDREVGEEWGQASRKEHVSLSSHLRVVP